MKQWKKWAFHLLIAMGGFFCSIPGVMGFYPLVPAYTAICCGKKKKSVIFYVAVLAGIYFHIPFAYLLKYVFLVAVISVGIVCYLWSTQREHGGVTAVIAGFMVFVMNFFGDWLLGSMEALFVIGVTMIVFYVWEHLALLEVAKKKEVPLEEPLVLEEQKPHPMKELAREFSGIINPRTQKDYEWVNSLEKELSGTICASCSGCAVCYQKNSAKTYVGMRAMLRDVVEHEKKEEIMQQKYGWECTHYSRMVDAAISAFSRMELNDAWYQRLLENRKIIAGQLDAVLELLDKQNDKQKCLDKPNKIYLAKIMYEVHQKGLEVANLHVYQDNGRYRILGDVSCKWDGGVPSKNYRKAVEKALKMPLRFGQDARGLITKDVRELVLYEDVSFYTLPGIATEKKNGSSTSGDSFLLFDSEDGFHHVCLSDGMGSGSDARQESEMVVELMEKFVEAGFSPETAIALMNSAMILQGANESYSTFDYANIDLYEGVLRLYKIGAACSFIKRNGRVKMLKGESLPTGVEWNQKPDIYEENLQNGDFLVMVSDGVVEYLHARNEQRLAEWIEDIDTQNAGVFAKELLSRVMLFTGGYAMDDMTILVTGIWEK